MLAAGQTPENVANNCAEQAKCRSNLVVAVTCSYQDQGSNNDYHNDDGATYIVHMPVRYPSKMPKEKQDDGQSKGYDDAGEPELIWSS